MAEEYMHQGVYTNAPTVTADSTMTGEVGVYADATAGKITITRPSAPKFPQRDIFVEKSDASANVVAVGTDTLTKQNERIKYTSDGVNWVQIK